MADRNYNYKMAEIKVLDDKTINQIAAGEVVERPVSVVKELVENAIDAGAKNISIEIKEGGISLIRITDNGSGIPPAYIKTAFLRHATSKIRSVEDLLNVKSLGFRGEALSSIAAVSQIELLTKTKDNVFGIRYCMNGGKELSFDEVGVPEGTTIIVRNLFFNTPARRKFLKSAMTEGNYISELVERLILSHPEISFKYTVNGKEKLLSYGDNDIKNNIYSVFGRDLAKLVIPVSYQGDNFKIYGFIGKPETGRGNRNFEIFFVNSRYVKSSILSKAVEEAYKSYLMVHKYPFVCLYFDIDPEDIDVNVHPAKTEIRFMKEQELYRAIVDVIISALSSGELISQVNIADAEKLSNKGIITSNVEKAEPAAIMSGRILENVSSHVDDNILFEDTEDDNNKIETKSAVSVVTKENVSEELVPESLANDDVSFMESFPEPFEKDRIESVLKEKQIVSSEEIIDNPVQQTLFENNFLDENNIGLHKIVGQIFDTYWIVEFDGKMFIIDQHAAHEKVLYERFKKQIDSGMVASQSLSPAIIISLNLSEINILNTYMDNFNKLGFEVEHFGGKEYAITSVPTELFGMSEKNYFLAVLDDLVANPKISDTKAVDDRIATMACKAAIKGNMKFTRTEAEVLIKELLSLDNPYNCPHGRPTIISYKKQDLEKLFKRIV